MTASPNRPRSQNAASAPIHDPAKPVREPATAGSTRLRALPPTLFKLRNLNAAAPAKVIPPAVQEDVELKPIPAPLPIEVSSVATSHTVGSERQKVESSNCSVEAPPRRSFASRLSSQSLVLFVILAIAITGIVVGNRGADSDAKVVDLPQMTEDLKLANSHYPGSETESNIDPLLAYSNQPQVATTAGHSMSQNHPMGTAAGDATTHHHTDDITSDGMTQYGGLASNVTHQGDQALAGQVVPSGTPSGRSIAAATADTTQSWATDSPLNQTAATNPSTSTGSAERSGFQNAASDLGTHTASHPIKTRTPMGIDDWSRYLPNTGPDTSNTGTIAATSGTPQSPLSSYQQYLDSLTPNLPQTTTPVGYLADPGDVYGANTVGTQAQLPNSTSPSQRR